VAGEKNGASPFVFFSVLRDSTSGEARMFLDPYFKRWRGFLEGPVGSKLNDVGLLTLRLGFGLSMMLNHGYGKFQKLIGGGPIAFDDPFGLGMTASFALAMFAEFFCSMLLVMGLATRLALTQLIATMSVAFFIHHRADPFQVKELAFLYLLAYAGLLFAGPGRLSIDAWLIGNCYCKSKRVL
jgi:putative oxidoreductase